MSSFHDTLAFVMTHEHKERITVGAQRKMRFLLGWGDLGRSPGACVGRALWAKAGGWWQHPTPRDWVGLGGLGVPFPRAPSAKQRSLDPSPLELGTQGPCWSMARGQSPGRGEVAQDEGGGDSVGAPSRPTVASSTPTMAPRMGQRG